MPSCPGISRLCCRYMLLLMSRLTQSESFWENKRWKVCVEEGLLIGRFRLEPNKVYNTDPEFTAPGGLYVYLWVCGVDIKVTLFRRSVSIF